MQRPEHRQGRGKTQVAQGHDLVEAASVRDIVAGSPQRDNENQDASRAHRDHCRRGVKERRKDSQLHLHGKHTLTRSWHTSPRLQTIQPRVGEQIFQREREEGGTEGSARKSL